MAHAQYLKVKLVYTRHEIYTIHVHMYAYIVNHLGVHMPQACIQDLSYK